MPAQTFGLTPLGYSLKRLPDFQQSLEADIVSAFPGANTAAQSTFGQLIGVLSAVLAERDEQNLAVWSAFQLTQAEGANLDNLGLIMGILRNNSEPDDAYRARLLSVSLLGATPQNASERLCQALKAVPGVDLATIREDTDESGYEVIVRGGDDTAIAEAIFAFHPTGINILGDTIVNLDNGCGFCQPIRFTRPTEVPVCIRLVVKALPDPCDCDVNDTSRFEDAVFASLTQPTTSCVPTLGAHYFAESFYGPLLTVGTVAIVGADFSRDGGSTFQGSALELAATEFATFERACIEVTFAL